MFSKLSHAEGQVQTCRSRGMAGVGFHNYYKASESHALYNLEDFLDSLGILLGL